MSYVPSAAEERVAAELDRLGVTTEGIERGGKTMANTIDTAHSTTLAEERLIQAALRWDELGHVGSAVDPNYCPGDGPDCDHCPAQTEYREAADALKAERAAA